MAKTQRILVIDDDPDVGMLIQEAAKANGKVWVNTESGVYHKRGRWYGKTKSGKFMTEADAKAAGYKPAH